MVGLTGTHEQIAAMAKTYGMDYMAGEFDGEYLVFHTAFTFLMDPNRELKAFAHGVEVDELSHAIREVLESRAAMAESS